jgi:hypothetical protein
VNRKNTQLKIFMKHHSLIPCFLLCSALLSGATDLKIDSFSDGQISWSNTVPNAVYQVEWRNALSRGGWTNRTDSLVGIMSTNPVIHVEVPQFYRVTATSYPEETNSEACYQMYSNALLDAAIALSKEMSTDLLPLLPETPGTEWRTFTNWVDGTTSQWVKVNTMLYRGPAGWTWNSLLVEGEITLRNDWSNEIWVTPHPQLYNLCKAYSGTHQRLRMQKALGLPPRSGDYGVVEFFVDPKYLFRPAPDPSVVDRSAGLAPESSSPYLAENPFQGISEGYAAWYRDNYNNSGYEATNDLHSSWPWTRLGYTYDYANVPNRPVGLSE